MNIGLDRGRWPVLIVAAIIGVVIAAEAYLGFFARIDTFRIEGARPITIAEFADGATVSHAFLMRGDGLQAVSVLFNSTTAASVWVQWTVWRGYPDEPSAMSLAFEETQELQLRPGSQWRSLTLPRDSSSHDRWYTIRLRLLEPRPASPSQVSVMASLDNPDRGGVLWINDARQPGSLFIRAERRGRTLYRRFRADAEPHLPAALRIAWVQWLIVAVFHWALIVFAFAVLDEAWPGWRRTSS